MLLPLCRFLLFLLIGVVLLRGRGYQASGHRQSYVSKVAPDEWISGDMLPYHVGLGRALPELGHVSALHAPESR